MARFEAADVTVTEYALLSLIDEARAGDRHPDGARRPTE